MSKYEMSDLSKKVKDSSQKKELVSVEPKKEPKKSEPVLSEMVNK